MGGGRWFKHRGEGRYEAHVIDDAMRFTQCARANWCPAAGRRLSSRRVTPTVRPAGTSGPPESGSPTRCGMSSMAIPAKWATSTPTALDIMIGEMGDPGAGDDARTFVWYGDREGRFTESVVSHGQGIHEGKVADLDGDGDLDILLKPYHHHAPRIDVLLNEGP